MSNKIISTLPYFGSIDLYMSWVNLDSIEIDLHENYLKGTSRNRATISTAQGIQLLSIPLKKGKNQQQSLKEVQISYDQRSQKIHWNTLVSAYNNSPFFLYYKDLLHPLYHQEHKWLWEYNLKTVELVFKFLKWNKNIHFTENYIPEHEVSMDLRKEISFLNFKPYNQVFEDKIGFQENLCILDLIFNQGPQAIQFL